MVRTRGLTWTLGLIGLLCLAGTPARAQEARSDQDLFQADEIAELKRQVAVVTDELVRLRDSIGLPEDEQQLQSYSGLGPAASRVYGIRRGLSLGGYAEWRYTTEIADTTSGNGRAEADMLRTVMYVGYKFTDQLIFNTEFEFEHAGSGGGGSVSVELATLDYLYRPELSFRAGLLLLPMGFLNEVHEPPFYLGTHRPSVERQIIPTTWRENGMGVYGQFGEGRLQYRVYVVNGLDATGFSSSGLRGGRQKGSRALANDLAFVARLDVEPWPGWLVGGSYYHGGSGQDQDFEQPSGPTVRLPDATTRIFEAHSEYRRGPLFARALFSQAYVDEAGELSLALEKLPTAPIAEKMLGGYVEVSYDLMQWLRPGSELELSPFFRWEYLDTQWEIPSGFTRDRGQPRRLLVPGIQFKPIPNVVLKMNYRDIDNWDGTSADEFALGFGLVF